MNFYQDTVRKREFHKRAYHWWLLVTSIFFLHWNEVDGNEVQIRRDSRFCLHNVTAKTLSCNLQQQNGRLLKNDWKEMNDLTITNGSSLIILPQCPSERKVLYISNTRDVSCQAGHKNNETSMEACQVDLHLLNSTAKSLTDSLFSLINVKQSRINAVNLKVDQFHILDDSYVGDFDILSTSEMSTIKHSTVESVTRMHIKGNQKLEILKSRLNKVRKFIYNSSYKESFIRETEVDKVYADGFEMLNGTLTLESVIFTDLSSEAMVIHGGIMHLRDVRIENAYAKSIIMKGPGEIMFSNVSIGDHYTGQSFQIKNEQNQELWPLAVVIPHKMSLTWPVITTIGVFTGFVFIIMLVAVTIALKHKKLSCGSMKQYLSYRNSVHSPEVMQQTLTPDISSNVQNISDEVEEVYTDVQSGSPPSSSMVRFNNKSESTDLNISSVAAKPLVKPMPHQLQNIKMNFNLKAAVDVHRNSHPVEVNDDEEPIYETFEDYIEPTHNTVTYDHYLPAIGNPHFLSNDKTSVVAKPENDNGLAAGHLKGHQFPQISEEIKAKSFLYNNKKPLVPTKPKIPKDAPMMPPMMQTSKLPQKIPNQEMNDRFGQLHKPALTPFIEDNDFVDNQEDPDEIYENIP